jgi:hypothetical protein
VPETTPAPEGSELDKVSSPSKPRIWAAGLPYIVTAVAAVFCSVLIQRALVPVAIPVATPTQSVQSVVPTLAAVTSPTSVSRETSTPAIPTSSALPADNGSLRLALLDLEAANRRLWSAIYLLRAASQLDDSVVALQSNDLGEVDRILLNARRSLDRAYAVSAEQEKGPIDAFRIQISQARDDLNVRPEGLDRHLRQMRQLILSLVDESGA